jgi:hypothetical protein
MKMLITIKPFFSIWIQLASFSFCCAGQFSDLLIIRLCLTSAYVFMMINGILGGPLWPHFQYPHHIQLDQILWSIVNLYVHISTVVRLFQDERTVPSLQDNPIQLALWRMFFRTGGISQKVFEQQISQHCEVILYRQNDILDTDTYFYIIYQGTVQMTVTDIETKQIISTPRLLQSGQMFDFRALGLLVDYSNLLHKRSLHVTTISKQCIVYRFLRSNMINIVLKNPQTKLLWKERLMENMLQIVQHYYDPRLLVQHPDPIVQDEYYIHPNFYELDRTELPHPYRAGSTEALRNPLYHIYQYMIWSFAPPWPFHGPPIGLRHHQLLIGTGTGRPPEPSKSQPPQQQTIPKQPINQPLKNHRTTTTTTTTTTTIRPMNERTKLLSTLPQETSDYNYTINTVEVSDNNNQQQNRMVDYSNEFDPAYSNHIDDILDRSSTSSRLGGAAAGIYGLGFIPATGLPRNSSGVCLASSTSSTSMSRLNDTTTTTIMTTSNMQEERKRTIGH